MIETLGFFFFVQSKMSQELLATLPRNSLWIIRGSFLNDFGDLLTFPDVKHIMPKFAS